MVWVARMARIRLCSNSAGCWVAWQITSILKQAGVNVIKALKLSPEDEQKVFAGNARRLLKI